MATRAIAFPDGGSATRWGERVALPVGGLLLVLALVTAMAVALAGLPPATSPRVAEAAPVGAVDRLDPIGTAAFERMPRSDAPVAGLAFIRCTNLWTSNPDGSSARRVLSMAGLSSPAFSPDARTIAVFASEPAGVRLWLLAADGSRAALAGTLSTRGTPIDATPAGLTWSPGGGELAFALSTPDPDTWTIWTLDVATGRFRVVGEGAPTPAYVWRFLLGAGTGGASDFRVLEGRGRWAAERLSGPLADRAVSVAPGWWKDGWRSDTASLAIGPDGATVVQVRHGPSRGRFRTFRAPAGVRIDPSVRPAVVQGGPIVVTFVDDAGDRDLGLLDTGTGDWTTLDYAWDPAISPAPPATGSLGSARAVALVQHLLWRAHRRPGDAALVLEDGSTGPITDFRNLGFTFGPPGRARGGWLVPATLFGTTRNAYGARTVTFEVRPWDGRLTVGIAEAGAFERVRTVDDAFRLLRSMVTVPMLPLPVLPAGTTLAREAVNAYTWAGETTGQINLRLPSAGRDGYLTFNFGDGGFGCVEPVPTTLATGTPAIATDPGFDGGGYQQVGWPAERPRATTAAFGISADLPREAVLAMAAEMDRWRLANR